MRQQHDRIVSFISPDDFGSKIDDVLMRRASETGHWFLSHDTFKDWVHGEGKTLWCPGIPGAGKTTLMSIAIEHLHDRFAERDDAVVLYIFCDYRKRNDQNPRNLLANLWGQLLRKRVLNEAECQSLKERYVDKNIRLLVEDIRQLTYEEARRYSRYFILVDALDELEEEHRVPLLDALYTLHPGINLLITSRIMRFNELGLRHAKELEIMAEDSDLRKYIVEREGRLEANVRKDKKLIRDIEDVIIERAQGMFLLAKLHLESIVTKRTPRQDSDNKYLADRTICWVCRSQRPLTILELRYALSVEPDEPEMDENDDLIPESAVIAACAGLITVEKSTAVVRFVHYTTQEYFEAIQPTRYPNAQLEMTEAYVAFLCLRAFSDNETPQNHEMYLRNFIEKHPFLEYAANYWGHHARLSLANGLLEDISTRETIQDLVDTLMDQNPLLITATRVLLATKIRGHGWGAAAEVGSKRGDVHMPPSIRKLNYFAYFGLDSSLQDLIDEDDRCLVESGGGCLSNIAHWAVLGEHESSIRLILGTSAAKTLLSGAGYCDFRPFYLAVHQGNAKMASILLEYGADPSTYTSFGLWTPLHQAAAAGYSDIVAVIISTAEGRDTVFSTTVHGDTPLHVAAHVGNPETLKLLLGAAMESSLPLDAIVIKLTNRTRKTPLHFAAEKGVSVAVKMIVDSKLGVKLATAKDGQGFIPFQNSVTGGSIEVARLFLDWDGVELGEAYSKAVSSSLLLAAGRGLPEMVQLLFEYIDRVRLVDALGNTIFHSAARTGSVETVGVVLDKLYDESLIDAADSKGMTPLLLAASLGHAEVCEFLIRRGADLTATDESGHSALHHAAIKNLDTIVNPLIAAGAALNGEDKQRRTPYAIAVEYGSSEVATILIGIGAQGSNQHADTGVFPATSRDQLEAGLCIRQASNRRLPYRLISKIIDFAEYWLVSRTQRSEKKHVTEYKGDSDPLFYLRSRPVVGHSQEPVRCIIFNITSHDQGFSDYPHDHNTYRTSSTWFDAWREYRAEASDVMRRAGGPRTLVNIHASSTPRRRDVRWPPIHPLSHDFPHIPDTSGAVDSGGFHWNPDRSCAAVDAWVREIRPGDRVSVVPKAAYAGWCNYVESAEISVYTSCWKRH
ncbi:Ankyrin-3 [Colletotrichum fructicola]|nr:Ankyrin-3 [Colletotrichum fructicola]KAF4940671.1 Ankyrin-3 [Colletotrichum fructicola]